MEKKTDTVESCTPIGQQSLDEISEKQRNVDDNKITKNYDKYPQVCDPNSSSEDVHLSCNSVVPQQVRRLTSLEADAAEKGSRHTMEDASVILLGASFDYPGKVRCAHCAVYDGHGGRLAAEYAQKHLHKNVLAAGLPRELVDVKATKKAILEGFRRTDESLLQESAKGNWQDGATAVCVWILDQMAGGSVGSNGRLQGRREVSRAFGDRQFKKVLSS